MRRLYEPCIPTRGAVVPPGKDWLHENQARRVPLDHPAGGKGVRLFTRNGHDWTGRFPLITEAALRNRQSSFVIDGEAFRLGGDGAGQTSTACTRASTTMRCSSTRSTCWFQRVTTSGSCRSACARRTS
jgi:hypothetical protein